MKKSILLTGGSGFIGRNLKESLAGDYELWVPARGELDLLNPASVHSYFKSHQPDVLIHSATTPGHRNAKTQLPVLESNLQMFFNLQSERARFGQFINLGSGSEYDMRHYEPKMSESYFGKHIPSDPAGFSKYISSRFLETDPSAVQLRLFGVFGKYEDYEIRFISNALCKALFDLPITIKQNRRFSYLYIDDLAPILRHFIENKPKHTVYNVVPDEIVELQELAQQVRTAVDKPSLQIKVAAPGLGLEYSGDNRRLHEEIPGLRFTPFRESVRQLAMWYSEHRSDIRRDALITDK